MNFVMVMGHLGGDPEERVTSGGQKVTTFNIASNTWRNGQDQTDWYRISIWGDSSIRILPHLKKGSGVIVTGTLHTEIYTNRDGVPQISRNVTAEGIRFMPGGRSDRAETPAAAVVAEPQAPVNTNVDDDLPF